MSTKKGNYHKVSSTTARKKKSPQSTQIIKKTISPLQEKISKIKTKLSNWTKKYENDPDKHIELYGLIHVAKEKLKYLEFKLKHGYTRDVEWDDLTQREKDKVALTYSPTSSLIIEDDIEGFDINYSAYEKIDLMIKDARKYEVLKNLSFSISMMTPDEYLDKIFWMFWQRAKEYGTPKPTRESASLTDEARINKYATLMKKGTKFPIPYIDYTKLEQEGRHRAKAAKKAGIDKIPVVMVFPYNYEKEESGRLQADYRDFLLGRYKE